MNPLLHLHVVGLLMLLLCVINLYVPRRFHWRDEMASLSLLNRQIFQVHAAFIVLILAMFAALNLCLAKSLLEPTPLARALLGALAVFWLARLFTQRFVYSNRIWKGHRFNTIMHYAFTALWLYITAAYTYALAVNLHT